MAAPDLSNAVWRKSSRSNGQGQCVECAYVDGSVAVRDSKDPDGPVLVFTVAQWRAFLVDTKDGDFDIA